MGADMSSNVVPVGSGQPKAKAAMVQDTNPGINPLDTSITEPPAAVAAATPARTNEKIPHEAKTARMLLAVQHGEMDVFYSAVCALLTSAGCTGEYARNIKKFEDPQAERLVKHLVDAFRERGKTPDFYRELAAVLGHFNDHSYVREKMADIFGEALAVESRGERESFHALRQWGRRMLDPERFAADDVRFSAAKSIMRDRYPTTSFEIGLAGTDSFSEKGQEEAMVVAARNRHLRGH